MSSHTTARVAAVGHHVPYSPSVAHALERLYEIRIALSQGCAYLGQRRRRKVDGVQVTEGFVCSSQGWQEEGGGVGKDNVEDMEGGVSLGSDGSSVAMCLG